jgi:DNA gyrase subunit A
MALMGSGTLPVRFSLRSALECFLDFRFSTIRRKAKYQIDKVSLRAHIVDGLLIALKSVDNVRKNSSFTRSCLSTQECCSQQLSCPFTFQVIELVRSAADQNAARNFLMNPQNENLSLSREQADAVLKLQLGQLTRLNKNKLEEEKRDLEKSRSELQSILETEETVFQLMKDEFEELKDKFSQPRKTKIEPEEGEILEINLVRNSRSVIIVTRGGYIKRMPLQTFESQGRGTRGKKGTSGNVSSSSLEDEVAHFLSCNDHDTLLMTTQKGIAYGLRAYQIPIASRTAKGASLPSVLPIKVDDVITSVLPVGEFTEDQYCVLATEYGWIKKTPLNAFENLTSRGLIIATLDDGDKLSWCEKCTDSDDLLLGSTKGMATRFEASELRPTGRTSRGVRCMKLRAGDTLADLNVIKGGSALKQSSDESSGTTCVLAVTKNGYGKRVLTDEFRPQARGGVGLIAMKFKSSSPSEDKLSCLRIVNEDDEVLITTSKGIIVRQKVSEIACQGRSATGVSVQKVDVEGGDYICRVSIVPKYEESDD